MTVKLRDVALRAGVSSGTVSNVLNRPELVSREMVARVRQAISELGFIPNEAARQLRAGTSKTVAYLVPNVRDSYYTAVAKGADDQALSAGLGLTLANSDETFQRQSIYLDFFEQQRMHSVLITPIGDASEHLARLRSRGSAVVLVDRYQDGFSSVSVDNVLGGRIAVEHLLELGRRRIAIVGSSSLGSHVADRYAGAARGALEAGVGATVELVDIAKLDVDSGIAVANSLLDRHPADRPDALFAVDDLVAIGIVLTLAASAGVRVPEDLAIVGYGDIEFARSTPVSLSSIAHPARLMGRRATELALHQAADPGRSLSHLLLKPRLVVRETSRAR